MSQPHLMQIVVRGEPIIVVTELGEIRSAEGYTPEQALRVFFEVIATVYQPTGPKLAN